MMSLAHKISFEAHRLGVFTILTPHHFHNIGGYFEMRAFFVFIVFDMKNANVVV
jgi:hypothetical protein